MKTSIYRLVTKTVVMISLLFAVSCGRGSDDGAVSSSSAPAPPPKPEALETITEGMITFLTGDVVILSDDGEIYPEIGDALAVGNSLVTGADGLAEIQFGDVGAVRIQSDTTYRLETYSLSDDGGQVSSALDSGSLVAKIRKLAGDDKFEVNVPGAVCAVRGTQFLVRADEVGAVTVAVSEGTVAISPPSLAEVGGTGDKSADDDGLTRIRTIMPLVSRDQEVKLPPQALAAAEQEVVAYITKGQVEDDESAALEQRVLTALEQTPAPEKLKEENAVILVEEEPTLVSFSAPDDSQETVAPKLVPLTIRTEPSDSRILINGRSAGVGRVSRVFEEGAVVSVSAVDANGNRQEQRVVAGEIGTVTIIFDESESESEPEPEPGETARVEPTPTALVAETPKAEEPPAKIEFRMTAIPSDTAISVEGASSGRGSLVYSGEQGEQITITAERPGYEPFQERIRISPSTSPYRIELNPKPIISRTNLPSGPAVGSLGSSGNLVIGATGSGALFAVDRNGRVRWTLNTKNTSAENATPVLAGNRGYIIGNKELVIFEPAAGRIIARTDLTGDRADLFGRRPLPAGNQLIVPSDSSLVFVDPATGEEKSTLSIPQGSRMSPAAWNSNVVISDQRGTLLLVDPQSQIIIGTVDTSSTQPIGLAPAVSSSGVAVFSGRRGVVSGVNLGSKSLIWERTLSEGTSVGVHTDAVIFGDSAFLLGDDTVYALSLTNGKDRFPPIRGISAPPMVQDGVLYLCRDDGTLLLHDARSGDYIGEVRLGERISARPAALAPYVVLSGERSLWVVDPRSLTE